jgi:hypothetical protein
MIRVYWFTQFEHGGFPIERAALGSCDLSMLHIDGEWQWLVRQAGRDVAEGAARTAVDAHYVVDITPTLFGDWAVLREMGPTRLTRHPCG